MDGLLELHRTFAADRDPRLRAELVSVYDAFARAVVRDFNTTGVP